jgi:transcription initiation factor TFIID subunit TAF12
MSDGRAQQQLLQQLQQQQQQQQQQQLDDVLHLAGGGLAASDRAGNSGAGALDRVCYFHVLGCLKQHIFDKF